MTQHCLVSACKEGSSCTPFRNFCPTEDWYFVASSSVCTPNSEKCLWVVQCYAEENDGTRPLSSLADTQARQDQQTKIAGVLTTTWKKRRHYERSSWFAGATQILHWLQEIKQLPPALLNCLPPLLSWLLPAWFLGLGALFSLISNTTCRTQILYCGASGVSRVRSGKVSKAHQAINRSPFFNKQELVEGQQRHVWEFYFAPGTSVSSFLDNTFLFPPS